MLWPEARPPDVDRFTPTMVAAVLGLDEVAAVAPTPWGETNGLPDAWQRALDERASVTDDSEPVVVAAPARRVRRLR